MTHRLAPGLRTLFMLAAAAWLAGCVAHKPMITELRAQQFERITLVVDENPFAYEPALGDNLKLTAAARQRGVLTDHRQAFADELVRGLQAQGLKVTVAPLPYVDRPMMSDRWPSPAALERLPRGSPAYYLFTEFGQCSGSWKVEPCLRLKFYHVPPAQGMATTGFQGVLGMHPRRDLGEATVVGFRSTEDAQARIGEFDAGLAVYREKAVGNLLKILEAGPAPRR